jgi:hypothetical protein
MDRLRRCSGPRRCIWSRSRVSTWAAWSRARIPSRARRVAAAANRVQFTRRIDTRSRIARRRVWSQGRGRNRTSSHASPRLKTLRPHLADDRLRLKVRCRPPKAPELRTSTVSRDAAGPLAVSSEATACVPARLGPSRRRSPLPRMCSEGTQEAMYRDDRRCELSRRGE